MDTKIDRIMNIINNFCRLLCVCMMLSACSSKKDVEDAVVQNEAANAAFTLNRMISGKLSALEEERNIVALYKGINEIYQLSDSLYRSKVLTYKGEAQKIFKKNLVGLASIDTYKSLLENFSKQKADNYRQVKNVCRINLLWNYFNDYCYYTHEKDTLKRETLMYLEKSDSELIISFINNIGKVSFVVDDGMLYDTEGEAYLVTQVDDSSFTLTNCTTEQELRLKRVESRIFGSYLYNPEKSFLKRPGYSDLEEVDCTNIDIDGDGMVKVDKFKYVAVANWGPKFGERTQVDNSGKSYKYTSKLSSDPPAHYNIRGGVDTLTETELYFNLQDATKDYLKTWRFTWDRVVNQTPMTFKQLMNWGK